MNQLDGLARQVIPEDRPVLGRDAEAMRYKLNLTVGEMRFALGLAIQHWTAKVRDEENVPIRNVTIALILRYLDKHPENCPILPAPDMKKIHGKTGWSNQAFSLALGCHSTAAVRWLAGDTNPSQPVNRLARHLEYEADRDNLAYWTGLVLQEAKVRGLGNIFEGHDTWTPSEDDRESGGFDWESRPVIGDDLEMLRQKLGLSVEEMRYTLGMTMPMWGKSINKQGRKPVSPTVALLCRYLSDNPERCPIDKAPSVDELMELTGLGVYQIGIVLGKQMVSGRRWENSQSRFSPAVTRLAVHLAREARDGNFQEWIRMVEMEARLRGIDDIWKAKSWTTKAAPGVGEGSSAASDGDASPGASRE